MDKKQIYDQLNQRHTKKYQEKFDNSHVVIVGLGGLGSNIAILLARLGIGNLYLVDFDKVDISNIQRQQYYLEDIGQYKTDIMEKTIKKINPYINVVKITEKLDENNMSDIFKNADIICEAVDSAKTKAIIVDGFFENFSKSKKLVCGNGMTGFSSSNSIKTKKINENFYICGDFSSDIQTDGTLTSARVAICAGHQANMIIRLIIGKEE